MDETEQSNALHSPADWVVVAEVQGMAEGEILAGRLRTAGIPAWISRESAGTAIAVSVGALGRIEVLVPADRFDEAATLLFGDDDEGEAAAWLEGDDAGWLGAPDDAEGDDEDGGEV